MKQNSPPNLTPESQTGKLGTFSGVFTPSVLTILGIILFLRLGYVVGNVGLGRALMMIGLANAISVLTSISLAAIATNLRVKGGGDYYLISRTLGVEFGGAIGIVLFLAQSVSIAFYCMGFGEAVAHILSSVPWLSTRVIAGVAVSLLFVLAWLGADWATRFQYGVMILIFAALVSFFWGGLSLWDSAVFFQSWSNPSSGLPFWTLFAIFFPAVTGFTQGVSMSGDLKDPGKSLPLGTFLAVGISILVYFGVAVVFAGALPLGILAADYDAMGKTAHFAFLIDAGVIAATLSSAMASFLGAPRILQSLSTDRIFPFLLPFSKGVGPTNNPRRGVLLSAGIAFLTVALGNLNVIAPVVSMFFLISYGLLNYATFFEARSASPSFRPRFRWFHPHLSLVGALACMGVMLAIDFTAGIVAVALLFAIFQYLKRTAGPARWADSNRSYQLQQVREHLLAASRETEHPRDWRPQMLVFSNDPERRKPLLSFASWIHGGSGLITAVHMLEGDVMRTARVREEAKNALKKDISENLSPAFPLVVTGEDLQQSLPTLIQSFGVGPLKANMALFNWSGSFRKGILGIRRTAYANNIKATFRLGCNILLLVAPPEAWAKLETVSVSDRRIDVWWRDDPSGRLMLLLAHLMTRNSQWEEARIRLMAGTSGSEKKIEAFKENLGLMLDDIRIQADPQVVTDPDESSIATNSGDATVVLIPFRIGSGEILAALNTNIDDLAGRGMMVALVLAAEDIDLDAEPEEGKHGEVAAALDALTAAGKKAGQLEKEATEAREKAEEAESHLQRAMEEARPGIDREEMAKIETSVEAAREAVNEAHKVERKLAKARAGKIFSKRHAEAVGAVKTGERANAEKPAG
ncbi:MAG: amino acid permease [Deltaproteobacteria bacterium]|nr:amino acid permease [Deltaproteobacteria bacterium]